MIRRGPLIWALALIAVGVVLLLQNTGAIPDTVSIWPIVLIAVGVALFIESLAAGRARGGVVVPILLVALGAWFVLQDTGAVTSSASFWPVVLIAIGVGVLLEALPGRRGETGGTDVSIPADGAREASVDLQHGVGRLRVGPLGVGSTEVLTGRLAGRVDRRDRRDGGRVEVVLRQIWRGGRGRRWRSLDWDVRLSPDIPIDLEVRTGASDVDLDLAPLRVPNLRVETGASGVSVTLPARGRTAARVAAGAANVELRVPPGVAARIRSSIGLAGLHVDRQRFPQADGGFASPEFDEAEDRVEISLEGGAASFSVR